MIQIKTNTIFIKNDFCKTFSYAIEYANLLYDKYKDKKVISIDIFEVLTFDNRKPIVNLRMVR